MSKLPDEILSLDDSQTACQYCGISYLLLNKLEKLKAQVEQMELERDELRDYIKERPSLLALKKVTLDQALKEKELQLHVSNLEENEARLESINAELQTDLETEKKRHQNEIKRIKMESETRNSSTRNAAQNLKHEFLLARNEMAHMKGIEQDMLDSCRSQILKIVSLVSSRATDSMNSALAEQVSKSNIRHGDLLKDIDRLQQDLKDSLHKSDRMSGELSRQKQQFTQHISNQKLTIQTLESNNINLEEKFNSANTEILELTTALNKIQVDLSKLRDYKQQQENSKETYEQKILLLETSIQKLHIAHTQELDEIQSKSELSARLNNNSAVQLANQALAKKDAELRTIQNALKSANAAIDAAKEERIKTIEAHQSRIKHLQEKYMSDVKNESAVMVEEVQEKLRVKYEKEILDLKEGRDNQIQRLQDAFDREMFNLQRRAATAQESLKLDVEEQWTKQLEVAKAEKMILEENSEREIAQLAQYIEELKLQLKEARERANPDAVGSQEKLTALKCDLVKKDNEISFLKETVRIECEERMGLVAMLAKHQHPRAQSSAAATPPQSASINNPLVTALKQVASTAKSPTPDVLDTLSSKDAEFLRLFKSANAKNMKRLAKQRGS